MITFEQYSKEEDEYRIAMDRVRKGLERTIEKMDQYPFKHFYKLKDLKIEDIMEWVRKRDNYIREAFGIESDYVCDFSHPIMRSPYIGREKDANSLYDDIMKTERINDHGERVFLYRKIMISSNSFYFSLDKDALEGDFLSEQSLPYRHCHYWHLSDTGYSLEQLFSLLRDIKTPMRLLIELKTKFGLDLSDDDIVELL